MSKLNQDQELMSSILAKERHTLYAEEIILVMNYAKEQQAKIDELHRRNQMLNDNIKEQGQKLVYQNEVIETQAEKLLALRDEKAGLQKRVDAAQQLIEDLNECYQQDHQNKFEYWRGFADRAGTLGKRLEQALKGGDE